MSFVANVIYGLKQEYGMPVTFKRQTFAEDYNQGLKTVVTDLSQYVQNVIFLPLDTRQAFYKAINLQSEIYLHSGEQQIVVDTSDLQWLLSENDFLIDETNLRYDITRIENITNEALILTVRLTQ